MNKERKNEKEIIILPKDIQIEMMEYFLKTSIPRKKKLEKLRLSNPNDRSDT